MARIPYTRYSMNKERFSEIKTSITNNSSLSKVEKDELLTRLKRIKAKMMVVNFFKTVGSLMMNLLLYGLVMAVIAALMSAIR